MQDGWRAYVRGAVSVHGEDRRALDGADGLLRRLGHVPLVQGVVQSALVVPVERLAVGRENREKERERDREEGDGRGVVHHLWLVDVMINTYTAPGLSEVYLKGYASFRHVQIPAGTHGECRRSRDRGTFRGRLAV